MSESLWPYGLQHTRLPCPSLSPRVCSHSCWLTWWYLTISSSATLFFFCLQSFPASESLTRSWLFASGGLSIGASASASVLPTNIQGWYPLGWAGWVSLQPKELSIVFPNPTVQKHQFFGAQFRAYLCCFCPLATRRRRGFVVIPCLCGGAARMALRETRGLGLESGSCGCLE